MLIFSWFMTHINLIFNFIGIIIQSKVSTTDGRPQESLQALSHPKTLLLWNSKPLKEEVNLIDMIPKSEYENLNENATLTCMNKKQVDPEIVVYRAAVLEYTAYDQWDPVTGGNKVLITNAQSFVEYAEMAKEQEADIMVTPEYGLQSFKMNSYNESTFLTFTQYVPNPSSESTPCHLPPDSLGVDALRILSCGALEHQIYMVVDLAESSPCSMDRNWTSPFMIEASEQCPQVGYFVYNTQVVFNRNGSVIARYRKQNLFLEDGFTQGPLNDSTALFLTDFQVEFSLQICFDIVFEHPGYFNAKFTDIHDVVMSTAWIDELPFDTANGIQNGWSKGLGVNLIVSGHHIPNENMLGSGIFRGYTGQSPDVIYDRNSGNVLLVSSVQTIRTKNLEIETESKKHLQIHSSKSFMKNLKKININPVYLEEPQIAPIIHEDCTNYTRMVLKPSSSPKQERLCQQDICCDLTYSYSGNETYMFMIMKGRKSLGGGVYLIGMQICGVVWCRNDDISTCAYVEDGVPDKFDYFESMRLTSSNFDAELIEPYGIDWDLNLIDNSLVEFQKTNLLNYTLSVEHVYRPLSVAIYGRWYSNDF